jgi:hypothetical protein
MKWVDELLNEKMKFFWGGGGSTTTEGQIPAELKPLINGSVQRMLGLQNYFWGNPGSAGYAPPSPYSPAQPGGWGYNELTDQNQRPIPPGGVVVEPGPGQPAPQPFTPGVPSDQQKKTNAKGGNVPVSTGTPPYPFITQEMWDNFTPEQRQTWTDAASGNNPFTNEYVPGNTANQGPTTSGLNIMGENPRGVAGASTLQKWAGGLVPGLSDQTEGEKKASEGYERGRTTAGMQTASDYSNDPAVKEAVKAFQTFEQPIIQDQASLMGNGRSSGRLNDLSMGLSSMMLPQIQAAQQRDENRINRMTEAEFAAAQGNQSLGSMDYNRRQGAINTGMQVGGVQRDIAQEGMDAKYEDFLRRAAIGENALMGPFGGLVPSTIGSVTRSSGK